MQKKILFTTLVSVAILITVVFLFKDTSVVQPPKTKNIQNMQHISVDEFVRQPELYKGVIAVSGTVKKSLSSKSFFALGCEDACILMPVKYDKPLPKTGTKVTAIGILKKDENGKYVFNAASVKSEK